MEESTGNNWPQRPLWAFRSFFDRIWVWRLHRAGVPEVHAGKQLGSSRLASGTAPVDRWGIGILPA
jgi:hypothetical protein